MHLLNPPSAEFKPISPVIPATALVWFRGDKCLEWDSRDKRGVKNGILLFKSGAKKCSMIYCGIWGPLLMCTDAWGLGLLIPEEPQAPGIGVVRTVPSKLQ